MCFANHFYTNHFCDTSDVAIVIISFSFNQHRATHSTSYFTFLYHRRYRFMISLPSKRISIFIQPSLATIKTAKRYYSLQRQLTIKLAQEENKITNKRIPRIKHKKSRSMSLSTLIQGNTKKNMDHSWYASFSKGSLFDNYELRFTPQTDGETVYNGTKIFSSPKTVSFSFIFFFTSCLCFFLRLYFTFIFYVSIYVNTYAF